MSPERMLAVNQFTTMQQGLDADLELYQNLGIHHIELCEHKFSQDPGEAREQLAKVRDMGFHVTSVQPRVHAPFPEQMAEQPEDPEQRMKHFRHTIDLFGEGFFGDDLPLVTISGRAPDHNYQQAHAAVRRLYADLADYAVDRNVRIAFEMLHPVYMNVDSFICRLNQALRLIEDVDRPNFGLTFDVWHLWEEHDLMRRVAPMMDRVFVVHIADWPPGGPRRINDRLIPGQGVIDLGGLLGAVEREGYRGAYALEILSDTSLPDSLWNADPRRVVQQSREAFERIWEM